MRNSINCVSVGRIVAALDRPHLTVVKFSEHGVTSHKPKGIGVLVRSVWHAVINAMGGGIVPLNRHVDVVRMQQLAVAEVGFGEFVAINQHGGNCSDNDQQQHASDASRNAGKECNVCGSRVGVCGVVINAVVVARYRQSGRWCGSER